jgi:hypothetical protein
VCALSKPATVAAPSALVGTTRLNITGSVSGGTNLTVTFALPHRDADIVKLDRILSEPSFI